MSTITDNDMKHHAPFDVAASRRDFLMGTTALTLSVVLPGSALGQSRPTSLSSNSTDGAK